MTLTWNAQKKELWIMNMKDLREKLKELQDRLFKDETEARAGGSSRMQYQNKNTFMIGELRKRIACVINIIKVRENEK